MKRSDGMNVFGVVMTIILAIANLLHLLWTVCLTLEQIKTGWGGGTSMDLGVLWPWLIEFLCAPALVTEAVFFVISFFKRPSKSILIANICLFSAVVFQYVLTNLFIHF